MSSKDIKKNKKWLKDTWHLYTETFESVCETSYKENSQFKETDKAASEAYKNMQKILDDFEQLAKQEMSSPAELVEETEDKNAESTHADTPTSVDGKAGNMDSDRKTKQQSPGNESVIILNHKESNEKPKKIIMRFQQRIDLLKEKIKNIKGKLPEATKGLLDTNRANIEAQFKDITVLYNKICDENYDDEEIEGTFILMRASYEEILEEIAIKYDENIATEHCNPTRLEDLRLPIFNGTVDNWNSFQEIFSKLVDSNKMLSNVEKFYRLKNVIKGDAARLIQYLQVTGENYNAAWTILEHRIIDHSSVNIQNAASIKQLLDTATESYQAIKAMGIPIEDADPFIARILIRKLDKEVGHSVIECRKFTQLSVSDKNSWINKSKLCKICFAHKNDKKFYKLDKKCEQCGGQHHSMLHFQRIVQDKPQTSAGAAASMITKENSAITLLATAQIQADSASGEKVLLRALLDQGSQRTSISEEAAQILRLHRTKSRTDLIGLGNTLVGISKSTVELVIRPRFKSNNSYKIKTMVLSKLTSAQPNNSFNEDLKKWDNYCLADPMFNKSDRVDIVLGADILTEILQPGLRKWGKILGQETSLGWILSGVINTNNTVKTIISAVTSNIERFWEIEEVCEAPEINETDKESVIRDDHSTTKVRVVFDASAKTTNGKSLNEILHTGPKLQLDLFQLLIK
ncbi:uncharacterized protein LOC119663153 [Teleopsis dalmanni]|uniref:uncharacterized protein LOC119663153 n=1 Tax=Teleopsis dalmanni TaxID=139649 RepID=UPI0018CD9766|nr:uncharacterized protein LOC119663153 [Teleopsis dalmanni]